MAWTNAFDTGPANVSVKIDGVEYFNEAMSKGGDGSFLNASGIELFVRVSASGRVGLYGITNWDNFQESIEYGGAGVQIIVQPVGSAAQVRASALSYETLGDFAYIDITDASGTVYGEGDDPVIVGAGDISVLVTVEPHGGV